MPTTFIATHGRRTDTYQYSVARNIQHFLYGGPRAPGFFLHYEFTPQRVVERESRESVAYFLVRVCAVVGGVSALSKLIDSLVFRIRLNKEKQRDLMEGPGLQGDVGGSAQQAAALQMAPQMPPAHSQLPQKKDAKEEQPAAPMQPFSLGGLSGVVQMPKPAPLPVGGSQSTNTPAKSPPLPQPAPQSQEAVQAPMG